MRPPTWKDLEEQAGKRFHSTTNQAATVALRQGTAALIGPFQFEIEEIAGFEQEAREIFPNTDLALEGVTYRV